jgi:hypothetical protein
LPCQELPGIINHKDLNVVAIFSDKKHQTNLPLQAIRVRNKIHERLEFGIVILHVKLIVVSASFGAGFIFIGQFNKQACSQYSFTKITLINSGIKNTLVQDL